MSEAFREKRVSVRGERYSVLEMGLAGAPCFVWLHGFLGRAEDSAALFATLASSWRCVAVDLPGHGNSFAPVPPERGGVEELVEDLTVLFDLLEINRPVLAGYSFGGRVALAFAALRPGAVGALLLESASPGLENGRERVSRRALDEKWAQMILDRGLADFVKEWEAMPLFATQKALSDEARARQRRVRLAGRPEGLAASLLGAGAGSQPSYWGRLPEISAPTLILTGAADAKFTEIGARMTRLLPSARHAVHPAAGHNIHLEDPSFFTKEVFCLLRTYNAYFF